MKNKKTTNTRKKRKRNQCARKILLGWWKLSEQSLRLCSHMRLIKAIPGSREFPLFQAFRKKDGHWY